MKRTFEPTGKKPPKQKTKFRNFDDDYLGPRNPPKDNYKRKLKHRNALHEGDY